MYIQIAASFAAGPSHASILPDKIECSVDSLC